MKEVSISGQLKYPAFARLTFDYSLSLRRSFVDQANTCPGLTLDWVSGKRHPAVEYFEVRLRLKSLSKSFLELPALVLMIFIRSRYFIRYGYI